MKMQWSVGLAVLLAWGAEAREVSPVEVKWHDSYQSAMDVANREDRVVMLYFTGSDWCSYCRRLNREIMEKSAFYEYAHKYLAPVVVDFPRHKRLSTSQQQHNDTLSRRFSVGSFPTLVFVDQNGRELHRRGYQEVPAAVYVDTLHKKLLEMDSVTLKRRDDKVYSQKPKPRPARDFGPVEPPPLFCGAVTAPPARYTNLVLKSISGAGERRLALVNNQTLGIGETASVKLGDRNVRVRCTEIRERSVLVKVDGEPEPREVRLAGPE